MKKNVNFKSIKMRLVLMVAGLIVVAGIVCCGVSGVIIYVNSYNSMVSNVKENASAYSNYIQQAAGVYKSEIEATGQDGQASDFTVPLRTRTDELVKLAQKYSFSKIEIADAWGKTVDGNDVSKTDSFIQSNVGTTVILSTAGTSPLSAGGFKVSAQTGYSGVAIGDLPGNTFSTLLNSVTIGKSGYGVIVGKDGTIIGSGDRSGAVAFANAVSQTKSNSSKSAALAVVNNMKAGKTGTQIVTINGVKQCIAYIPIKGTDGWSLAVSVGVTEMMSSFYTSIGITIGLLILFFILAGFCGFKLSDPIIKPILKLVDRYRLLAKGDLHTEVPTTQRNDEITILTNALKDTTVMINDYVGEISDILGKISEGDLTVETTQEYAGDFEGIKKAIDETLKELNEIFSGFVQSASQVASGADQVAGAAQALSQGATEQASSIEQLSASITEIASAAGENASNAASANKLSIETSAEVEQGDANVRQMIDAMSQISRSSSQIGKIIKTIEDIAFQTNILALNAAVEAARAGTAGRGFAVVADEVRNLASKSAEAAKNTTDLIESSIRAVENGTKVADETGHSFKAITSSVRKMTELIGSISGASNNQATAINQISLGLDQISAVVQTNSATAEESAATSEELSGQAQMLKNTLSELKLKGAKSEAQESVAEAPLEAAAAASRPVIGLRKGKY
ncbi:MAG: methyl-accepting chemotaxis protein [Clostridia bacterium]|nr:methyl-accepting chemotaxis protein [Clostridia bacterium]